MAQNTKSLNVGVIGPAGFTGSHTCVELLRRGHHIVGISRNPEAVGTHPRYSPRPADLEKLSIQEIANLFQGLDILISAYGPHTTGADALQYKPFLELVRKLIIAVKESKIGYFIFIGGAGSLHVPGTVQICTVDHPDFFIPYRRAIADSEAHTTYMEERLGPLGSSLRRFRDARILEREGNATPESKAFIEEYEKAVGLKDKASDFIQAGRTSYMFFDGNFSFKWTYVSPSPLYRPGKRTGQYQVTIDDVPLQGPQTTLNIFEGRLTGITAADLAIAISDEVEQQQYVGKHWTAVGDLSDDTLVPSYVTVTNIGTS
ncbi:NAD(P)-binding protein [Glonium stellatum]|uniref:NAD(P)-binding protein n=1 Tax=Glonium stellatum TaxID=574774 RepID=A0A8E2F9Z8_9PEZI|nr:NAD(P)-binding protein [Glonium stellatum]